MCFIVAVSGSGSDGGRSSIGEEIKKALSNNNASPVARRLAGPGPAAGAAGEEVAESSDTQSAGASSPPQRKHHPRQVADVSFPRDSDTQKLFDLIRPKSTEEVDGARTQLQVKKVTSKKYSDSESSTSGSEPGSPNISLRPESSFGCSDSVRSSLRSSSAVSSDGRMTIVTESYISDIDTLSVMSELPQETPIMIPGAKKETTAIGGQQAQSRTVSAADAKLPAQKSPDPVIERPLSSSQNLNSSSTLGEYEPAETLVLHKVINNRRGEGGSSDSEDDFTTEQITKVKFRRVSKRSGPRSRSPSPESRQIQTSSNRPKGK